MGAVFSIEEVLEIAVQIEKNGGVFYRKAAEICADHKDFLLEIAEQEDEHARVFGEMQEAASADNEPSSYDPDNEGAQYLQRLADSKVFDVKQDPLEVLKGDESLEDIVDLAISAEKDSIVFYTGLKEVVPGNLGSDQINSIIREEIRHITWLMGRQLVKGEG